MCPCGEVDSPNLEDVLVVPQRLTQSAYATLKRHSVVPETWHLEGRFGSRTHRIDEQHIGLPILSKEILEKQAERYEDLKDLLQETGVSIVTKPYLFTFRSRDPPEVDGRIHPERERTYTTDDNNTSTKSSFTYAELFAGKYQNLSLIVKDASIYH